MRYDMARRGEAMCVVRRSNGITVNLWLLWRHPHLRLPMRPPSTFLKTWLIHMEELFDNDLSFLLTSFSRKRLRLECAFLCVTLGSYNIVVNPRVVRAMKWSTPFVSQRWQLFSSNFQIRRKLSHILLVNAWLEGRCRTVDWQQHKSNAQEQIGAYW